MTSALIVSSDYQKNVQDKPSLIMKRFYLILFNNVSIWVKKDIGWAPLNLRYAILGFTAASRTSGMPAGQC
jgi:hypothetical protein